MSTLGASQPAFSRTEALLIEAARGGDERAFGELYERYSQRIFAYVLSIVRDHGRAEDIVQDVFVSALRRMRCTDCGISFKPWIYEIAKNACIDELRRVQRGREVSIEQGSGDQLASADPGPDTSFERGQQLAILNGAFRGLSERQHKVMVLRELEGLSYTDIAARTGMTVPMVESTLLRARRRLSQEYDEIATGRRCQQVHAVVDTGGQAAVDALGLRERRRFARHVAHCQPCARYVHLEGVSAPETGMPAAAKKIAGLLPFPIARWSLPWGPHSGNRDHASGLLRSARRAAQFAHPGAPLSATPATVATVAAVVIAGGGAAVGLLEPDHTAASQPAAATISARPTADKRAVSSAPLRTTGRQLGQAASVSRTPGGSAAPRRSGTARASQAHHSGANGSSAASTATPAGTHTSSTQPSGPATPSTPAAPSVHLPVPVPTAPVVPATRHLVHTVTSPVSKVVKQLPVPKLPVPQLPDPKLPVPKLPGGPGLPNTALGGL